MPIYEYSCPIHGKFEVAVTSWRNRQDSEPCPVSIRVDNTLTDRTVNLSLDTPKSCGLLSLLTPSLVAISPDTYWSGKYDERLNRYFTARSDYRDYLKNPERNGLGVIQEGSYGNFKRPDAREVAEKAVGERDAAREQAFAEVYREYKASGKI